MTEQDWLNATAPQPMLDWLRQQGKLTERKARLFAVACCRRIWPLLTDERSRRAVEVAERYADGQVGGDFLAVSFEAAHQPCFDFVNRADGWDDSAMAAIAARHTTSTADTFLDSVIYHAAVLGDHHDPTKQKTRYADFCCQLRDLFNPFREARLDPAWLTWNHGTVVNLAQVVYDDQATPEATLDRTGLGVLADAFEEAGCTDADTLAHMRSPGPHVRGCWPVDLLLGKG